MTSEERRRAPAAEETKADVEDHHAEADEIFEEEETPSEDAFVEDENDIVPGQPDAEVEAFFDSAAASDDAPEDMIEAEDAPVDAATDPNSIAAKLQRIRAVVAQQEDTPEDADYTEDQHAESEMQPAREADVAEAQADEDAEDVVASARREIEEALDADEEFDTAADEVSDAEVDDIAAMLARMNIDDDAEEAAPAPKAKADEATDHGIDTLMAEISAQEEAEDAPESLFATSDEADVEAEADAAADALAAEAEAKAVAAEAEAKAKAAAAEVQAEAKAAAAEAEAKAAEAEEVASQQLRASKELRLEAQPETEDTEASRPRARVIKVKRADLDAAIARGDLEEYDEEDAADEAPLSLDDLAPAKTKTSSLSAEEEDELARELAALEADIEMDQGHADAAPAPLAAKEEEPAAVAQEPTPARAKLPAIDDGKSDDVDRLLAETDHQMGEPESATRRDAFAHLRAAVAAKKADEALGSQDKDASQDDAYRNDLADVVRPRRPASKSTGQRPARPTRPTENRSAPLKLVAEQRVDVDRPSPAGPVRPRRVAGIVESASAADESFGEFASEMGATKLPDLLEAAAAYMAFVEGREEFSRPQLMTKVRQATSDGFSREDTLRSFGQLLREGKIEKIKGGRFVASDDIGFRPDQRAAS